MTESFLFNAAAEAAEEESRLAGNPPLALVVDPHGVLANPEGDTPVPDVVVQTPTELAPEGPAPEVAASAAVPAAAAVAVIPAEGGVAVDVLPLAGIAVVATVLPERPELAVVVAPALDLPEEAPIPVPAPSPEPQPQPGPEPEPWPPINPGEEPYTPPVTPEPPGPPEPLSPSEPPGPHEPPGPLEPPPPEEIQGRWKIDQTSRAGDKTGGDVTWENPEHGQKADTIFDVSFNAGSLKLDEGQQIQVYLDVYDQHGAVYSTTATPNDWMYAVSSRDPGFEVVSSTLVNGQLVVTLEAGREGVNLTGDVFCVEVTAVADDQTEGQEQLVFDINDTDPARDLTSGVTIGSNWDTHDDLVIAIEENPHALPLIDQLTPMADLVEAFEHQVDVQDHPSADLPLDLSIPDHLQDQGHGFAYGHDGQGHEPGGSEEVVVVADPDQLPEDKIEHASDGVGVSFDDRGGLDAVWNRLG